MMMIYEKYIYKFYNAKKEKPEISFEMQQKFHKKVNEQ